MRVIYDENRTDRESHAYAALKNRDFHLKLIDMALEDCKAALNVSDIHYAYSR